MPSRRLFLAAVLPVVVGCYTTRLDIRPAQVPVARPNSVVIEKSRAEVWAKGIPELAKRYFVINNIDQASGLINVSYSGDPRRYVEGPVFTYTVTQGPQAAPGTAEPEPAPGATGATGVTGVTESARAAPRPPTSVFTFEGTRPLVEYMWASGEMFAVVSRAASLEGRANIVLEALGPTKTLVTATVRYVLSTTRRLTPVNGYPSLPEHLSISFNTGGRAAFDAHPDAFYYPTGTLELELLEVFE